MPQDRPSSKVLVVIIVLLCAASSAFAEKVLLRCRYKAGDKYSAEMLSNQDIDQTLPDGTVGKMKQTIGMYLGMEVLSVAADGTAETRITYRRVVLKQESLAQTIDYDSADPKKKDLAHAALIGFKALVGQSIDMKVTDRGEIISVKGVDRIVQGILSQIPEGPRRQRAKAQLDRSMSEEHFKKQMSGFSMILPENPVGVGDGWDRDQTMSMGYVNMVVRTNYKVRNITRNTVDLDVRATIQPGPGDPDSPVSVKIEEGVQSGIVKVNRVNAAITDGTLTQKMKIAITAQGQTMSQNLKGTTRISVVRD